MQESTIALKFLKKFPDEDTCEKYILAVRFPNGISCPFCRNIRVYRIESQKRFKCGTCRKQFTTRTGSVLAESKVPLQKWLMTAWIMTSRQKSISALNLAKTIGVTQKTAWRLAHKINEALGLKVNPLSKPFSVQNIDIIDKKLENSKKLKNGRLAINKSGP